MKFLSPEIALYLYKFAMAWNTVVRPGLVPLVVAFWNYQISYKKGYAGLSVLHLLFLLNPWLIVKIQPALVFCMGITLVDVHLNWLKWFLFLFLEGALLIILVDSMIAITIPRYCKHVYVNSFFLFAARLWNSLPLECFRITESHFEIENMQMRHHYQNTSAK